MPNQLGAQVRETEDAWDHALAVIRPAILLASPNYLDDIANWIGQSGLRDAVREHDTVALFDWIVGLAAYQGVSDAAASSFAVAHGGVSFSELQAALSLLPSCQLLRGYWTFDGCGYRKGAGHCAQPLHQPLCPLPRHDLRKGSLNIAAYSFYLFVRDICDGDLVAWIDARLSVADPGQEAPDRAARMRRSLLGPLANVAGIGSKLWNMILADLLLVGDPLRERWVVTGAAMIAIDSLIHNYMHRTGILRRLEAQHPYGPSCYGPGGCASVIEGLAARFDARQINPTFPRTFPRFVQHAIWRFCSAAGLDICNGNKIDDRCRCRTRFCPTRPHCDRFALRPHVAALANHDLRKG